MMRFGAVLVGLLAATPLMAQTPPPANQPQAFYEFLMARRLEAAGDTAGALAALERARTMDPDSAELHAELSGFYARQSRGDEAVAEAEQALTIDAANMEAHHMLGQIYAAWAEGAAPPPQGQTPAMLRERAIDHLAAIQASPLMATDPNLQVTLGRLYVRSGRAKDAVPILERVVAQVNWVAEPFALLAEARVALGRMDEAAEALEAAAAINPRYWVALGDMQEREGKVAAAAASYGQAVQGVRSPSRDLRLRWATSLINVPDGRGTTKAREVLADLLKTTPGDTIVLALMSGAQRAGGDGAGAEATARKILEIEPFNVSGLHALALALFDRFAYRQLADALGPFAKDAQARSKGQEAEGAMVLVQLGIAYQQLGDYDAAINAYTGARTLTPRDPELDAYLVQAHLAARRFDRAEALAREALVRMPGQPRMVRLRAQALAKSGKVAEANTLLEEGVAAYPNSREYLVGLADLYTDQKRVDDAVRLLEQARKTFGDDQALTMRVASAYEAGGRLDQAEREFRKLMSADPLDANAMNSLGYMLADNGVRLPEALDLAQRAVKVEPDNPAYLDTLGWTLFKSGKNDEAVAPLSRAAAAMCGSSVIQEHHGDVLAKAGKPADAIAAWQRALTGDGEAINRAAIEKKIRDARARQR